MKPISSLTRALVGASLTIALATIPAAPGSADLASRYRAGQQQAGQLQQAVREQSRRIQGYEGTIASLQARLTAVQGAVSVQERLLGAVRADLGAARIRLGSLQQQYAHGRVVLAAELRAEYEAPPPSVLGVIVDAHGFEDLLSGLANLRAIERGNTRMILLVRRQRLAVAAETRRLTLIQGRRERATAAVVAERDQIAQLRLSIVSRELRVAQARSRTAGRLSELRGRLAREAAVLDAQAAAAQASAAGSGGAAIAPGGCASGPFVPHGGSYGFFPAGGTNYSVGEEPMLAARLDQLGRVLQLHLIGISGYRSPQHSVEVGGFADDPHTQGIASDTPGVEGVSEATLARFCLTRPFGGAHEADHIQPL
jgi:peptidoglycan hydrolase CwlO-like protein